MDIIKNETTAISPAMETHGTQSAAAAYSRLKGDRILYEQRAQAAANVTIPMLFRAEGATSANQIRTPWQGLGARGTKVLTSKMLLAILPANTPFWKYMLTHEAQTKLESDDAIRQAFEEDLARAERAVQDYIESNSHRPKVSEMLSQLIVAGNCLIYMTPEGKMRVYRLRDYAVLRDSVGTWLELVAHEKVSPLTLSAEIQSLIKTNGSSEKTVSVYTHVERTATEYTVYQEVAGVRIASSEGTYPLDACPWIPLRFYAVDGESYGRGYIEEYLGDLNTMEMLSQAVAEGSVQAARVVHGIKSGATTKLKDLQDAQNGEVIKGDLMNDITTLQLNKYNDFKVALETSQTIESRLVQAFMMNSSATRQADRVTAEEVRFMAQELEDVLGGIYSILAQEFQLPYLKAVLSNMEKSGDLPPLPAWAAKPVIVTGLGALGRGQDLSNLQLFLTQLQPFGEAAFKVINMDNYASRVAIALGIDTRGLVKTQQQIAQEQAQEQAQQMAQQVGPQMAQAAMDNPQGAQDAMAQAQGQPAQ